MSINLYFSLLCVNSENGDIAKIAIIPLILQREGPFFAHKADCHEIWHNGRTLCLSVGNVIIFVKF